MLNPKLKILWSYLPTAILLLCILFANFHKSIHIIKVEVQSALSILYFSGIANPMNTYKIASPVQGTIVKASAIYGEEIKKNQPLYLIKSTQTENDFRNAVETYIKAKSAYQNMLFQSTGNNELYQLGLISKVDFLTKQDQLKSNQLELWNAELQLNKIYEKTGSSLPTNLQTISMEKIEEVRKVLHQPQEGIQLVAPQNGLLLFPTKAFGAKSDDKNSSGRVSQGDLVQEGQILALVANTSGLNFDINVNEANYHDIQLGQSAIITSKAFAPVQLKGHVAYINHQANDSENSDTPMFLVRVIVPHLTKEQQQLIQVGMSAEVAIKQKTHPSIKLPLNAVTFKNNHYWVNVINANDEIIKETPVQIGETDIDSVEIISGLSPGENVVLPD